jgi:hypothetical protein
MNSVAAINIDGFASYGVAGISALCDSLSLGKTNFSEYLLRKWKNQSLISKLIQQQEIVKSC